MTLLHSVVPVVLTTVVDISSLGSIGASAHSTNGHDRFAACLGDDIYDGQARPLHSPRLVLILAPPQSGGGQATTKWSTRHARPLFDPYRWEVDEFIVSSTEKDVYAAYHASDYLL